jgi:hypothetical protein
MLRRWQKSKEGRPLSLAVMLSFNELAWIAAGGVVVMFVIFWNQFLDYKEKHPTTVSTKALGELERRPVLGPDDVIISRLDSSNKIRLTLPEYERLTNQAFLKSNEVAVDATWLAQLNQQDKETLRIPLTEYQALKKRPQLHEDQQIVPKSFVAAALTNQMTATQLQAQIQGLTNDLRRSATAVESLQNTNKDLWEKMASTSQMPQELLNLKGRMNNLAILLDRSASMEEKGRWTNTVEVVATWLKHLAIKKCVLILFSDSVETIPENGSLASISDAERAHLVSRVRALTPQGNTATVAALRTVYEKYLSADTNSSVDTIILFTDGKPFVPRAGRGAGRDGFGNDPASISRDHMRQAVALAKKHAGIPINVVALGDYFDREQAEFLLELKNTTGGAFLGR